MTELRVRPDIRRLAWALYQSGIELVKDGRDVTVTEAAERLLDQWVPDSEGDVPDLFTLRRTAPGGIEGDLLQEAWKLHRERQHGSLDRDGCSSGCAFDLAKQYEKVRRA